MGESAVKPLTTKKALLPPNSAGEWVLVIQTSLRDAYAQAQDEAVDGLMWTRFRCDPVDDVSGMFTGRSSLAPTPTPANVKRADHADRAGAPPGA